MKFLKLLAIRIELFLWFGVAVFVLLPVSLAGAGFVFIGSVFSALLSTVFDALTENIDARIDHIKRVSRELQKVTL
jgi:uncharacterized protein YqhQ